MYAKIMVQGPDAAKALNRVCSAQIDVDVGASVYTPFLNERGGIEADVTVTRLAEQRFLVIGGHPSQIRDQHAIARHADPNWRFEIFDATAAFALLSLHGPKARAILQTLSGNDLSATNLPFGGAAEIDLAHARVWVIRRSFLGELGFEILVSTEFAAGVYEAILAAGEPLGLRHMGMFALNACRIEKGFLHFGHDIGEDDSPLEVGLGFAVDWNKPAFVGRDALLEQRSKFGNNTAHRTAAVHVPGLQAEHGPYLIHNEPIWRDSTIVGHVTSGDFGFRLGGVYGLVTLHQDGGVSRPWIEGGGFEVQIAGTRYPIELSLRGFYDPAGERMRG